MISTSKSCEIFFQNDETTDSMHLWKETLDQTPTNPNLIINYEAQLLSILIIVLNQMFIHLCWNEFKINMKLVWSHFNVSWFGTMAIRQFHFTLLRLVPLFRFNADWITDIEFVYWMPMAVFHRRNESYDAGQMVFDIRRIHHNFNNLKIFGKCFLQQTWKCCHW